MHLGSVRREKNEQDIFILYTNKFLLSTVYSIHIPHLSQEYVATGCKFELDNLRGEEYSTLVFFNLGSADGLQDIDFLDFSGKN